MLNTIDALVLISFVEARVANSISYHFKARFLQIQVPKATSRQTNGSAGESAHVPKGNNCLHFLPYVKQLFVDRVMLTVG